MYFLADSFNIFCSLEWGKPAVLINPGNVMNIPAGVSHFHGATKNSRTDKEFIFSYSSTPFDSPNFNKTVYLSKILGKENAASWKFYIQAMLYFVRPALFIGTVQRLTANLLLP